MVRSATVIGIDAEPVEIEIDLSAGLAKTIIVGLPDKAVRESRDRVQAALNNCGYRYPNAGRMTINLAPASTRKAGPMYDLPIAVGILVATGQLQSERLDDVVMVGELALDGRLRPVQGILPIAGSCRPRSLVVPWDNGSEAAILDDLEVMAARSLPEVVGYLLGDDPPPVPVLASSNLCSLDLGDVVGQPAVCQVCWVRWPRTGRSRPAGYTAWLVCSGVGCCGRRHFARRTTRCRAPG